MSTCIYKILIRRCNVTDDLHNVVVAGGTTFNPADIANFDPKTFIVCGHHVGQVVGGTSTYFQCRKPLVATMVTIYKDVQSQALTICEVEVYSKQGSFVNVVTP